MADSNQITKWDIERAELEDRKAFSEREHDREFSDVVDALKRLDIDPRRLRDYLAHLS